MISLEQIRLLEGKISRAIELIRVLKEENATLRRGLDSAQGRMKELESLVDGFKADQKEIEGVIVRALRHLDDLETAGGASSAVPKHPSPAEAAAPPAGPPPRAQAAASARPRPSAHEGTETLPDAANAVERAAADLGGGDKHPATREELDIF